MRATRFLVLPALVGLQILGRVWDEAKLIRYAYAYEQATHYRKPPGSVPPLVAGKP